MNRLVLFVLIFLYSLALKGQDLHYSMFFNSPLNLNPGLTGVFNGDQRFHANYRQQWYNWPVEFQTFDVGADFKIRNLKKDNFFSVGALFNYDVAGDLQLKYNGISVLGSYSMKVGSGFITPGVGIAYGSRRFNTSRAILGETWDGTALTSGSEVDPLYQGSRDSDITFFDLNAGVNYRWQKDFRNFLDVGLSYNHLLGPNMVFNNTPAPADPLFKKLNIHLMGNFKVASKIDILVNGLASLQEPYQEIVLNGQGKFYLNKELTNAIYLGAGIRLNDAWYPMVAIEFNKFYAAFSYDLNIGELQKDGGPEFAIRYILAAPPYTGKKPCPIY